MALELERLQKAQRARGGAAYQDQAGFVGRIRHTLPLIVPIFVIALQRAERLAEAMEARAYSGGAGRGRYTRLHFRRADGLALGLLALFITLVFLI
jgi:energy-coupling factor transport system permease protein